MRRVSILTGALVVLTTIAGCAAEAGDEETSEASAELAASGLARYDFGAFDREGGNKTTATVASIDRVSSLATYVVELFIPKGKERITPGLYMRGDKRGFDSNFDPTKTRAFLVIDFVKGKAWLGANESHVMACMEVPPHACQTLHTNAPHDVDNSFDDGANRFWVDWVGHDTVRVHVTATVSTPGPTEWAACSVDHELLIDARSGAVRHEGDGFPSVGVYRYPRGGGGPQTMLQLSAGSPSDLCGDPRYSTPRRALATHRP